ncbi:MAG: carbohydrate kinase family protein [Patescibacteria group bacterium]
MDHDFLAIGDTVTDAFIKLNTDAAHVDIDRGTREICMRFADKIPYEDVFIIPAVGNSANAAVAAARLGLKSALVTNIGDDVFGRECLETLRGERIATDFVRIHNGKKTNYHYVLWFEDDRTILVKHQAYDYALPNIGNPRWIYLSSLGEAAEGLYDKIADYVESHSDTKLAFQPGTFQMKLGVNRLKRIYARTDIFFCNKEESQRILNTTDQDIKVLLGGIRALGPKTVIITDGPKGAYAYEGEEMFFMRSYPDPKPPLERTGAGDSFSSTVVAALAMRMPLSEALRWGPVNSMSVVQYVGAREGLFTREQIEEHLKWAPKDYYPTKI